MGGGAQYTIGQIKLEDMVHCHHVPPLSARVCIAQCNVHIHKIDLQTRECEMGALNQEMGWVLSIYLSFKYQPIWFFTPYIGLS